MRTRLVKLGRQLTMRRQPPRPNCVALATVVAALTVGLGPMAPSAGAAAPPATDVMFVFDTSGSMGTELGEAKEKIVEVMEKTNATLPNVEYGVSEVRDYPFSEDTPADEKEAEEASEKPWKLDQPLTSNTGAVKAAIEPLEASGGGDGPESYGRALWETDTNPNVGWRAGTRHEIVLVADNVPHDNNLDEGIPSSEWVEPEPWNTDFDGIEGSWELPGRWGIPGTVWTPGTNLDFQSIARQLGTDGKPLESVEFYGGEDGYLHYWEYWAGLSGGVALNGTNGDLAAVLTSIVVSGATSSLPPCPSGQFRNASGVCVSIHPSVTQVVCNLIIATASDTCTATLGDAAPSEPTNPTGTVSFTSAAGGVFSAGNTCTLSPTPMSVNTSSCSVKFLPPSGPSALPAITASYAGDSTHSPSTGTTFYGPASSLADAFVWSGAGTITPGTVVIPLSCGFPCALTGGLFTLPGLAHITSVSTASVEASIVASSHGKKKRKPKPIQLGSGTLKLSAAGKGKLTIRLSVKGRRALSHVNDHGVRLTVRLKLTTLNGTLVASKNELVTLRPKPKKKKK